MKGETPARRWTNPPATIDDPDRSIWTIVAEPGERHGLHAMYSDDNAPPPTVTRGNRTAWQIGPASAEKSRLYFAVQHPDFGMGKTPRVVLTVEYFDEGKGTVELEYDSSDPAVRKITGKPGAFKTHPTRLTLTDSGTWNTARFVIADAEFSNRCNARDFRLNVSNQAALILRSVGITLAD